MRFTMAPISFLAERFRLFRLFFMHRNPCAAMRLCMSAQSAQAPKTVRNVKAL